MKAILTLLTLFAANIHYAQSYGVIIGIVYDYEASQPTIHFEDSQFHDSVQSNPDGSYSMSTLPTGIYSIRFTANNKTDFFPDSVKIESGNLDTLKLFQAFHEPKLVLKDVHICGCAPRFWYFPPQYPEMNREEISESVNKFQLHDLAEGMSSRISERSNGELTMRGGTGNYVQLIDGVKSREIHSLPTSSLAYITIYDGFIPAKFGDATGGIIVVETLGYFELFRLWERENQYRN